MAMSRFERLTTPQLLELFAWQDAGLSYEDALAKVEEAARVAVAESASRVAESRGAAAYEALFPSQPPAVKPPEATSPAAPLREAATSGDGAYEALFGRERS